MNNLEINVAESDLHFEVKDDLLIIKVKKGVGESSSTLSPYYLSALKIQIDTLKRSEQELLPHPIQSCADEMLRCRNIVEREYLRAENLLSAAHSWEDVAVQQAISDVRQAIVAYSAAIDKARKAYNMTQIVGAPHCVLVSSNGNEFGDIGWRTTLKGSIALGVLGVVDISDKVREWKWSRISGESPDEINSDLLWNQEHQHHNQRDIDLVVGDDIPLYTPTCSFRLTATLPDRVVVGEYLITLTNG